jgi:hypothetical protein
MRRKYTLASAVIAVLFLSFVWFVDGGAPRVRLQGGAFAVVPKLERWQFLTAGDAVGGIVCTERRACARAKAEELQAAGNTCTWTARVWLSAGSDRHVIGRSVKIEANAVADRVNAEGQLISSQIADFVVPWDGGWWWRPEQERLILAVPVACDASELRVSLSVKGRSLLGRSWYSLQPVGVKFWPVPEGQG